MISGSSTITGSTPGKPPFGTVKPGPSVAGCIGVTTDVGPAGAALRRPATLDQFPSGCDIFADAAPLYHRHYTPGQSQFITTGVYRRVQLSRSDQLARHFVDVLRELHAEMKFVLIGWVLMPEHFHVLLRAKPADNTAPMPRGASPPY